MDQRPTVTIQAAQSLDGRISLRRARTPLSSREGLEVAHRTRSEHDAVLVGSSTVRIDDPQLSVRYCSGSQPRRIVVASALDVPLTAKVFAPGPGVMVVGTLERAPADRARALADAGVEVRLVQSAESGLVSMIHALGEIRRWGVRRLLVEGGARILTTLFREHLVDQVAFEIVPILLGAPGLSSVADIGVEALDHAPKLSNVRIEQLGSSVLIQGRVERGT